MSASHPTIAELTTDPEWDFAANPVKAVAHCGQRAATAWERGDRDTARRYASMASELVALAGNPNVKVGLVVENILSGR